MITTTPAAISRKNRGPSQRGDVFGFGFGGGCLVTRLDRLFGMPMMLSSGLKYPFKPMRYLHYFGKLLIALGVGVLLFVGWTLKGTDLYTNQQQDRLEQEFQALPPLTAAPPRSESPGGPPKGYAPAPGEPVFRLKMPDIDVDDMVVEGVGVEQLRMGPGHYPSCRDGFERPLCTEFPEVFPGEKGRVIVSGHRTTYGAPFWGIDKLKPGDEIEVEARWGDFVYRVTKTEIVRPDSLAIAVQSDKAELVLTTCHPRFSAAQRMIVYAEMVDLDRA